MIFFTRNINNRQGKKSVLQFFNKLNNLIKDGKPVYHKKVDYLHWDIVLYKRNSIFYTNRNLMGALKHDTRAIFQLYKIIVNPFKRSPISLFPYNPQRANGATSNALCVLFPFLKAKLCNTSFKEFFNILSYEWLSTQTKKEWYELIIYYVLVNTL